jgi:hypothetical protein
VRGYQKALLLRAAQPYINAAETPQSDTSDISPSGIELRSPPSDTSVSLGGAPNLVSCNEVSLESLQQHPAGGNGAYPAFRLAVEPGPLILVRLLADGREIARAAGGAPAASHVRLALAALAKARAPHLADQVHTFLSGR